MMTLDQIKDQDNLQGLINAHRKVIGWARNRPRQKDFDRGREQVAKQAETLHRLLEKFRLELHVRRDGTLRRIAKQIQDLNNRRETYHRPGKDKGREYDLNELYSTYELKTIFLPILNVLARMNEPPDLELQREFLKKEDVVEREDQKVGRRSVTELRGMTFKELFKLSGLSKPLDAEFIGLCQGFCTKAGDHLDDKTVRNIIYKYMR